MLTCASASNAGYPSNFLADPFLYIQVGDGDGDVLRFCFFNLMGEMVLISLTFNLFKTFLFSFFLPLGHMDALKIVVYFNLEGLEFINAK